MAQAEAPWTVRRLLEWTAGFFARIVPESVAGFVRAFGQTFAGERSQEVVGPVGMVGLASQAAQSGWIAILTFAGLINFSLALFNLLPIPGLDGGRVVVAALVAAFELGLAETRGFPRAAHALGPERVVIVPGDPQRPPCPFRKPVAGVFIRKARPQHLLHGPPDGAGVARQVGRVEGGGEGGRIASATA